MERRGVIAGQSLVGSASPRMHQPFPMCANDVLEQVTKFCCQVGQKWRGATALRNNELQHQLDSDLFCISPDRRVSRLNHMQQLRLLQILCDYFNERESEGRDNQYQYFESIFCGREGETLLHEVRISSLINLCSLAVQYPCYSVLNYLSQWLNKIGSGKFYAQQFVSQLVEHYIISPEKSNLYNYLFSLAQEAPQFAAYFITYSVRKETLLLPLILVLTQWLSGKYADNIICLIKETIASHFVSITFPYLVVYDCVNGGAHKNPLHGVITALYAEWQTTSPSLDIKFALEILASGEDFPAFDEKTLLYHVHLAKLSKIFTHNDLLLIYSKSKSDLFKALFKDVGSFQV